MTTNDTAKQLIALNEKPFNCRILSMSGCTIEKGFKTRNEAHEFALANELDNYYLREEK